MKKILLVATVLVGGMAFAQAGVNVSIGFGIPFPLPGVVIRQPAPYCPAPVYVAPPICPPRVVVPCGPVQYQYRPAYYGPQNQWRGYGNWNHHNHGHGRY